MDGLSGAASIIAVLQLTAEVIKYLNDVKDAPKECQQCMTEASNLQSLLITLLYHLNQGKSGDPWYTAVRALNVENGPLDQYKQALKQLRSKAEIQDGVQKVKRRLLWKFCKADIAGILARIERLNTLVSMALESDHFKLSQAIKDDSVLIRDALPTLQASTTALRDAQVLQQHHVIMEWLSPTNFPAQQHDIITRRQGGTGQWFLDSPKFKRWLEGSDKTLFCPGIPGAGKTMIAAIAIDHLYRTTPCDDIGVAYLFCSYKAQSDQSVSSLFAALLKQLVQSRPDIAGPVKYIYDDHSKRGSRPSLDEILRTLQSVCANYAAVHIIVDALDECTDRDGARRLIDKFGELQATTDVRLLCTARFVPEITQKFESNSILEVRASEEDVRRYVASQLPRLPNCIKRDNELKRAVENKVIEAVDGMFLLACLYVDSLLDKWTKHEVLSMLEKLSKGSAVLNEALDVAYGKAIKRIDRQPAGACLLAKRALSWITYAQRRLTTKELCHALAIEPGNKTLNNDNIYDVEDVISVCAGLVTVDEESNIIRLVHYTTQEYFERVGLEWNPGAQEEIAVACLTYLSFDLFRSGSCADDEAFAQRLSENPFFDYSAHYWGEHVRLVESHTSDLVLAFLCDEALVDSIAQGALTSKFKYTGYSRKFPNQTSGLHLAARYGLLYFTKSHLMGKHGDSNTGAESKDSDGRTPLLLAALNGHGATVKLLLETGKVDVGSKDKYDRTPLWYATGNGHTAVVRLLLEHSANVHERPCRLKETVLQQAAEKGHEAVVRLLLEHKFDINSDAGRFCGGTALHRAAENGHEGVVRLLLENKADVNMIAGTDLDSAYSDGVTALQRAAEKGHQAVVRLLLEHNADVNTKSGWGGTALHRAAENGHEGVVRLLLEHNAYVNAGAGYQGGGTALHRAAENGHEGVVRLLLEHKADIDAEAHWETVLQRAAEKGHQAVVRLLLEHKADANAVTGYLESVALGGRE